MCMAPQSSPRWHSRPTERKIAFSSTYDVGRKFRPVLALGTEIPYKGACKRSFRLRLSSKEPLRCGMTEEEIQVVVNTLASNPMIGDLIVGTGGFRKFRVAGRGKGKSGGFRVVTFYSNVTIPVFLIDVFSKGDKENLSKAERNELRAISDALARYGRKK
ncbi:MAG TPA: type II toxin-antitoxin system RelE/ParE family toxin [Rhizomicrobium sp.]